MVTDTNTNPSRNHDSPEFFLTGMSVYLSNPSTNPSLVNPDFLRYNEIVDPTWAVKRPVIIDQNQSRVAYANGLTISAAVDHIIIAQRAVVDPGENTFAPLESDDIICARVAVNYLETVALDSPYDFITIDPTGILEIDLKDADGINSPLQDLAVRIEHEGQEPDVQARAQYRFGRKRVTLYASEFLPDFDENVLRIMLSGEIFHELDEDSETQANDIKTSLESWEQDIQLFRTLVHRFCSTYFLKDRENA